MQRYAVNTSCPKCGDDKAATGYHAKYEPACFIRGEHMHRMCNRCGYTWYEMCLDATPEQAEAFLPSPSVVASSTDPRGYKENEQT